MLLPAFLIYFAAVSIDGGVAGSSNSNETNTTHNNNAGACLSGDRKFDISLIGEITDGDKRVTMVMDTKRVVTFNVQILCHDKYELFLVHMTSSQTTDVVVVEKRSVVVHCNFSNNSVEGTILSNNSCQEFGEKDAQQPGQKTRHRYAYQQVNVTLHSGAIGLSTLTFELHDCGIPNRTSQPEVDSRMDRSNTNRSMLDTSAHVHECCKAKSSLNDTGNSLDDTVRYLDSCLTWSSVNHSAAETRHFEVYVIREPHPLDVVFVVCVYCMEILEMVMFGTQLDMSIIKKTLRKPAAPLIGFVCQYIGMPLIAYAVARVITTEPLMSLGIFVAGICPGGGSSNIYAYLLDGDLSLSITMTTISTFMSLAMMPLWLYTLGREFMDEYNLNIPYSEIVLTLSVIIIPLTIGLFINYKYPKSSKYVQKVITWVVVALAILLIVTGVLSSLYIFQLFNLIVILVGLSLPYIGFLLGGFSAILCRQTTENVKTIALETGLQNTGIGFILLSSSLLPPFGDIATVAPLSAEVMSPIPPLLVSVAFLIRKWCLRRYKTVATNDFERQDSPGHADQEKTKTKEKKISSTKL